MINSLRRYSGIFLIVFLAIPLCNFAQKKKADKIYFLLDTIEKGDINYSAISSINTLPGGLKLIDSAFNFITGSYKIYRYLAEDSAFIYDESGLKKTNTVVLLKVNTRNIIVDGYWYFLENSVMPFTCYLYRISKYKKFKKKLNLKELKFKKVHKEIKNFEVCENHTYLKERGYLLFELKKISRCWY